MKILLLVPNITGQMGVPAYPHVGIAYLTSYLTELGGHSVMPVDLRVSPFKPVKEWLKQFRYDFIGITSSDLGYKKAYNLISAIKKITNTPIVIGGPHVSTNKSNVLRQCQADYAIKGEGEVTFSELCGGFPVQEINGLIWRDDSGIHENPDRPPITDLDALPFPAYDKFHTSKYSLSEIPIVTSRGCPFFCIYCAVHCIMGYKFRPRSPENVVAEIKHWVARGYTHFQFTDDNFTFDMNRAKRICDLIIHEQLKIKWNVRNGIRVDKVDKELLQKMKDSGAYFLFFGMESGSQEILKKIKKGTTVEQIKNAVSIAKEVGISVGGTFMIGHPDETYKDFLMSYNLAKSLNLDEVRFYNVIAYPNTELIDWIKNNGTFIYQPEDYLNNYTSWDNKPIFEAVEFTEKERKTAYELGHKLYLDVLWKKKSKEMSYVRFWLSESVGKSFIYNYIKNKRKSLTF